MSNTFRLETAAGRKNAAGTCLYDVTCNGVPILLGVGYTRAYENVMQVVADDDRYQEACDGRTYCDISGAEIKAIRRRIRAALS